ncbi:MAG TPA: Holliday junction resolvase RuvX, partial [Verrucomicrobiae bacterium]|nr:Holliday junction resolvase RuvX [Verrucomicrobiae bacterium]
LRFEEFRPGAQNSKRGSTWIRDTRLDTSRAQCYAGATAMRILALDHGTRRVGVAVSDELKMIATPLEFIPAEPFTDFLVRLKQIIREKEIELILLGMPRNMDGSYGPAALKVQEFAAALKDKIAVPIQTWDERLTSAQAQRFLIAGRVRREKRREKVDKTAAAILLQSFLDSKTPGAMP